MTLKEYLEKNKISIENAAKDLGFSYEDTGSKEIPPLENSLSPGAPAPEKINTLEKFENWVWQKDKTFCKWQDDKFIPAIQYLKKSLVENEEYYNRLKDEAVSYCQSSGRKYSDYVAFFRNWIWRDSKERGLLA